MARPGTNAQAALVLAAALTTAACAPGCGDAAGNADRDGPAPDQSPAAGDERRRPVVETVPGDSPRPFLDPDAGPTTALGRLRAQYLPVWTSDFDWAFPPETCGTAWELDGVAAPTASANVAVLGDFATAAALAVMRYEHQLSRALADPTLLSQLCVATASVDPARSEALDVLETYLESGIRRTGEPVYPEEVWIVAVGPTTAIAVACVTPGYPATTGSSGETLAPSQAPSRLHAYLLTVATGLEDEVADVSYRVANGTNRPAEDCSGLQDWAVEWDGTVQGWIDEGQIWKSLGLILTADGICGTPPPGGPDECPKDWPR